MFKKILIITWFLLTAVSAYAAPDLTIGSGTAQVGQTVSIPIKADLSVGIVSAQFNLQYDSNILTPSSVLIGTANPTWTIVSNSTTPGLIRIGIFSTTPITGTGLNITTVNFIVKSPTVGVTPLPLPNFVLSNVIFDEKAIPSVTNGNFSLIILGDVNQDGQITVADASLLAQSVVGSLTLTANQKFNADVSRDGTISLYDAALIAQLATGVITHF